MRKVHMRVHSKDLNRLSATLSQKFSDIKQVSGQALLMLANEIMDESLKQVPVDTHTLMSTAEVKPVQEGATTVSVKMGYAIDGNNAYNAEHKAYASEYMMRVHEDLSLQHPNGGKAKFLEDPLNAAAPKLKETLAGMIHNLVNVD